MTRDVFIVSAHPDDMEIGMGGTDAKLAESKVMMTSVVVTNGGWASNPFAWTEQRMAEVRRTEALRAAGILGVKDVVFFDEPDAADEINATAVKEQLTELIERLRPTEVYALHEELHRHPAQCATPGEKRFGSGLDGHLPEFDHALALAKNNLKPIKHIFAAQQEWHMLKLSPSDLDRKGDTTQSHL